MINGTPFGQKIRKNSNPFLYKPIKTTVSKTITDNTKFGIRWLVKVKMLGTKPIIFPKKMVEKMAEMKGIKKPAFLPAQLSTKPEINS